MFWRKRVIEISSEYPDVELSHMYVDNAAMQLIRDPKQVWSRLINPLNYSSLLLKGDQESFKMKEVLCLCGLNSKSYMFCYAVNAV